jgi:hypothetical protein
MDKNLRVSVTQLRGVIESIPTSEPSEKVPEAVGLAVDDLRRSLWGALTTSFAGDATDYLVAMRIRRANEMLRDVLADLHTGDMSMHSPGAGELRQTTGELRMALEELP